MISPTETPLMTRTDALSFFIYFITSLLLLLNLPVIFIALAVNRVSMGASHAQPRQDLLTRTCCGKPCERQQFNNQHMRTTITHVGSSPAADNPSCKMGFVVVGFLFFLPPTPH